MSLCHPPVTHSTAAFTVLFLVVAVLSLASVAHSAGTLIATDSTVLLNKHNVERAAYGMPALSWDANLATNCQSHATACYWGHSGNSERGNAYAALGGSGCVGENLAAAAGSAVGMDGWTNEKHDWTCGTSSGTCASGAVCGHYTQMIWKSSVRMGCATARCNEGWPSPSWQSYGPWEYLVCRYNLCGNYNGQHPLATSSQCNYTPSTSCEVSSWSTWGQCSASCNGGSRTRTRTITNSPSDPSTCGALSQTESCNTQACPVNCAWSSWSSYGSCSASCGGGTQSRSRSKSPAASNGGTDCSGASTQSRDCNTGLCPVDCVWGQWSGYTQCSTSCGGGSQTRTRSIQTPNANGGAACTGSSSQNRDCNTTPCAIDCEWGQWSAYATCTANCGGGTQARTRTKTVVEANGGSCSGAASETQNCNEDACPVDCTWLEWGSWSTCDATCNTGSRVRTRAQNPASNGGSACPGSSSQSEDCNTQPCPVDCVWGEWSAFNTCSAQCGGGSQTRTRSITTQAANGGSTCAGASTQSQPCNTGACPIDCVWGEWTDFVDCSVDCGGGTQTRSRSKTTTEANGGAACTGASSESQACNTSPCPQDCAVTVWSSWTSCDATCGGGTHSRSRTITTPAADGGAACPSPLSESQPCNTSPCPVDCVWAQWSLWGDCSVACAGGVSTRTRDQEVAAANGGAVCVGDAEESQPCNNQACPTDCTWNAWSQFTACSAECGGGSQTRTRTSNAPADGGLACVGESSETQACNVAPCAVPCTWNAWGAWGQCSVECAGGSQTRTRTQNAASNGGAACEGPAAESQVCNEAACPSDCTWNAWGEFNACSAPCGGGTYTRTRTQNAGDANGLPCTGSNEEVAPCNSDPCPQDCVWGEWTAFSSCTANCGAGTQQRSRAVDQEALNGGSPCTGGASEIQECNSQPCELPECIFEAWAEWSECSLECGSGVRNRNRVSASTSPSPCDGTLVETESCNDQECATDCAWNQWEAWTECPTVCGVESSRTRTRTSTSATNNGAACEGPASETESCPVVDCAVDCQVGQWSTWNDCSASCGPGEQSRSRAVVVPVQGAGAPCGETFQTQDCNRGDCPRQCEMSEWTQYSPCSSSCGPGWQYRLRHVIRSPNNNGLRCGFLWEIRTCNEGATCQPDAITADCMISEWGPWGLCSVSCGAGEQMRTRSITSGFSGDGLPCPSEEAVMETRDCSLPSCLTSSVDGESLVDIPENQVGADDGTNEIAGLALGYWVLIVLGGLVGLALIGFLIFFLVIRTTKPEYYEEMKHKTFDDTNYDKF